MSQLISQILKDGNAICRAFVGLVLDIHKRLSIKGLWIILEILALVYAIPNIVLDILQSALDGFCKTLAGKRLEDQTNSLSSSRALENALPHTSTSCRYASRMA